MINALTVLGLLVFFVGHAHAETFAIPTAVEWSPDAQAMEQHADHRQALEMALTLTRRLPPSGSNHIFGSDRGERLNGKRLVILNTTSEEMSDLLAKFSSSENTDAFTFTGTRTGKESVIYVTLLWDKLGQTEIQVGIPLARHGGVLVTGTRAVARPDVATRTSVALAHELFGNVQAQLEADLRNPEKPTRQGRQKGEVRAFQEGVNFIDRVQAADFFQRADESLRRHYDAARAREVAGLQSWTKAGCRFSDLGG